ncbi:peptidylprolyl isomerase [uncultured Sphingomonas sp.]|uniref:peptidylprolyl isomerase n=1 Tax=uncultured Sphingomonas sp. TaxID=158754 RepID=UPI0025DA55B4|nr:peptidylprolyl isomerase [uncultured Sphingomonas sp.]
MSIRIAILLAALLLPLPAAAQTVPAPPAAEARQDDLVRVALDTEKGRIVLALDRGRAPATVANFLRYIDAKRLDGVGFYRAMPVGGGNGLIQAGVRDARLLYPPVKHEPTSETGLKHEAGAVAMANAGPGTAQSDFFILAGPIPSLDRDFAVFGRVVEGLEVVKAILASPVSPTKGAGAMRGQMLEPTVKITAARRVE